MTSHHRGAGEHPTSTRLQSRAQKPPLPMTRVYGSSAPREEKLNPDKAKERLGAIPSSTHYMQGKKNGVSVYNADTIKTGKARQVKFISSTTTLHTSQSNRHQSATVTSASNNSNSGNHSPELESTSHFSLNIGSVETGDHSIEPNIPTDNGKQDGLDIKTFQQKGHTTQKERKNESSNFSRRLVGDLSKENGKTKFSQNYSSTGKSPKKQTLLYPKKILKIRTSSTQLSSQETSKEISPVTYFDIDIPLTEKVGKSLEQNIVLSVNNAILENSSISAQLPFQHEATRPLTTTSLLTKHKASLENNNRTNSETNTEKLMTEDRNMRNLNTLKIKKVDMADHPLAREDSGKKMDPISVSRITNRKAHDDQFTIPNTLQSRKILSSKEKNGDTQHSQQIEPKIELPDSSIVHLHSAVGVNLNQDNLSNDDDPDRIVDMKKAPSKKNSIYEDSIDYTYEPPDTESATSRSLESTSLVNVVSNGFVSQNPNCTLIPTQNKYSEGRLKASQLPIPKRRNLRHSTHILELLVESLHRMENLSKQHDNSMTLIRKSPIDVFSHVQPISGIDKKVLAQNDLERRVLSVHTSVDQERCSKIAPTILDLQAQISILQKRILKEQARNKLYPKSTSIVPTSLEANIHLRHQFQQSLVNEREKYGALELENQMLIHELRDIALENVKRKRVLSIQEVAHHANEISIWRNKVKGIELEKEALQAKLLIAERQLNKEAEQKMRIFKEMVMMKRLHMHMSDNLGKSSSISSIGNGAADWAEVEVNESIATPYLRSIGVSIPGTSFVVHNNPTKEISTDDISVDIKRAKTTLPKHSSLCYQSNYGGDESLESPPRAATANPRSHSHSREKEHSSGLFLIADLDKNVEISPPTLELPVPTALYITEAETEDGSKDAIIASDKVCVQSKDLTRLNVEDDKILQESPLKPKQTSKEELMETINSKEESIETINSNEESIEAINLQEKSIETIDSKEEPYEVKASPMMGSRTPLPIPTTALNIPDECNRVPESSQDSPETTLKPLVEPAGESQDTPEFGKPEMSTSAFFELSEGMDHVPAYLPILPGKLDNLGKLAHTRGSNKKTRRTRNSSEESLRAAKIQIEYDAYVTNRDHVHPMVVSVSSSPIIPSIPLTEGSGEYSQEINGP
ncbi:hypothetical protein BASA50_005536 [Batrachochytrium salamandrivorans]|uniref:Lebercilin domain-containing protein n=1 Tax=Batrachochytrium salamandrivorans TaxID=1357716 RepID=A0ABQ8FCB0_9FUNG|nr:hypothetical protein BASA50_005536 [Batrachochytrium salamandrivorans]